MRISAWLLGLSLTLSWNAFAQGMITLGNATGVPVMSDGNRSATFTSPSGSLRITAYGDSMVRVRAVPAGQAFAVEEAYEIVVPANHAKLRGQLQLSSNNDQETAFTLATVPNVGGPATQASLQVIVGKKPLRVRFLVNGRVVLAEDQVADGGVKVNAPPRVKFAMQNGGDEHFWGLGHPAFGRMDSEAQRLHAGVQGANLPPNNLDRHMDGIQIPYRINRPIAQANNSDTTGDCLGAGCFVESYLTVPFFMSNLGYGFLLNNMFRNEFSLKSSDFHVGAKNGVIDYYFIAGPDLGDILNRYTLLTGRPRMIPMPLLGFGTTDREDLSGPTADLGHQNQKFWTDHVPFMQDEMQLPFEIIVHDNGFRGAKDGPWRWDPGHFPDLPGFQRFVRERHLVNWLDFNRHCWSMTTSGSGGWKPSFAIPGASLNPGLAGNIGTSFDFPDFTNPAVRDNFWKLLFGVTFDPSLDRPGDYVWFDEFDFPINVQKPLANGKSWFEMSNYYLFLLAKAVGEGWDNSFQGARRPFFMSRGQTAGAQRFMTLWSGDIHASYPEMRGQIRSLQSAGLSGFPYYVHDAGGFFEKPTPSMYQNWGIAFGAFTPIWKPHGMGGRFPDTPRNIGGNIGPKFGQDVTNAFKKYGALRMAMLPYNYTIAHQAAETGMPMARAMVFEAPQNRTAWQKDLQYMWGPSVLVAPRVPNGGNDSDPNVPVWLPPGQWYNFETEARVNGPADQSVQSPTGHMPIFVKAGGIIPNAIATDHAVMRTTHDWDRGLLGVQVYTGADGSFEMFDDDGITDRFRQGEFQTSKLIYHEGGRRLDIFVHGAYTPAQPFGTPPQVAVVVPTRRYEVTFHGIPQTPTVAFVSSSENGSENVKPLATLDAVRNSATGGIFYDASRKTATVVTREFAIPTVLSRGDRSVSISLQ